MYKHKKMHIHIYIHVYMCLCLCASVRACCLDSCSPQLGLFGLTGTVFALSMLVLGLFAAFPMVEI